MANSVTKPRRRKATKDPPVSTPIVLPSPEKNDLLEVTSAPTIRVADQQRQRLKLKEMQELEDFRTSFSRGYAVIIAELAKKHQQFRGEGSNTGLSEH